MWTRNLQQFWSGFLIFELKKLNPVRDGDSDLLKAMKRIAETNKGPENQIPSAGCGIKWKTS